MHDVQQFHQWLEEVYNQMDDLFEPDPDQSTYNVAAYNVHLASERARRLGAPEVVCKVRSFKDDSGCCGRDEAKDALGLMLRWCREHELEQIQSLEWLTTKQAALYLQCSEDFIRDRCKDGTLPHQRVGREYRIKRDDLDNLKTDQPVTFRHLDL